MTVVTPPRALEHTRPAPRLGSGRAKTRLRVCGASAIAALAFFTAPLRPGQIVGPATPLSRAKRQGAGASDRPGGAERSCDPLRRRRTRMGRRDCSPAEHGIGDATVVCHYFGRAGRGRRGLAVLGIAFRRNRSPSTARAENGARSGQRSFEGVAVVNALAPSTSRCVPPRFTGRGRSSPGPCSSGPCPGRGGGITGSGRSRAATGARPGLVGGRSRPSSGATSGG